MVVKAKEEGVKEKRVKEKRVKEERATEEVIQVVGNRKLHRIRV